MGRYKLYLKTGSQVPASTKRMRALRLRRAENQKQVLVTPIEQVRVDEFQHSHPSCEVSMSVVNPNESPETVIDVSEPRAIWSPLNSAQESISTEVQSELEPNKVLEGHNSSTNVDEHDFQETIPPLCSHTECTSDDVMLMTLALGIRHKLTWVAMVDILKMFNTIYGERKIKASTFSFTKRLFETEDLNVTYHHFCDNCGVYIAKSQSSSENAVCGYCEGNISTAKKASYFVSLSMESQLKKLVSNEKLAEMIMTHRFSQTNKSSDYLRDIYDGSEYEKLSAPGKVLSYPENFSFSFFTDGVALGKSKKSLWPIYISINELSPLERRNHILLVGLYCGSRDPNQQVFLKPFVEEANKLAREGFSWKHRSLVKKSRVIALVGVADSVARCQLLNFQTFSAFYGCTFCYQKTERTVKRLKFVLPNKPVVERTIESTKHDLIRVLEKRNSKTEKDMTHKGVKGPSVLSNLLFFNLHSGLVVDYMHNILLGVSKTYFELVFDSTRRKFWDILDCEMFAMEDLMSEIDKRLEFFKPPTSISRTPRSIKDFGSWKANEWRTWLLFYSMPCLIGLLKQKHLIHIAMLSKATSLLLQTSVSRDDVHIAHRLFQKFSFYFQKYFGPEHMYYNIHLLSHICKGVLRWGPLWTHNAFMYEGFNRQLLFLCKNPYRVVIEISKKYQIMSSLPRLINRFSSSDNTLFFCEDVLERKLVRFKRCDSCILLGAGKPCNLTNEEKHFLESRYLEPSKCLLYDRMLFRNMRITTAEYASRYKNDDSVVFSDHGHFYQVRAIVVPSGKNVYLLANEIFLSPNEVLSSDDVTIDHISRIHEIGAHPVLITLDYIKGQCIVERQSGMFLSKIPLSYSFGD